ncbi:hypothetical protein ARMSODRAFT_980597 [Armillaria solidipes]|uniref:Uncharacterized protein n=1 Tax=Armillaria solidipes TaxID=1076256 RepID=A0A2H3B688_9AGAR|nr:hypothetical protein ARMSODRAFT_980597 [Armillaria solidipes]
MCMRKERKYYRAFSKFWLQFWLQVTHKVFFMFVRLFKRPARCPSALMLLDRKVRRLYFTLMDKKAQRTISPNAEGAVQGAARDVDMASWRFYFTSEYNTGPWFSLWPHVSEAMGLQRCSAELGRLFLESSERISAAPDFVVSCTYWQQIDEADLNSLSDPPSGMPELLTNFFKTCNQRVTVFSIFQEKKTLTRVISVGVGVGSLRGRNSYPIHCQTFLETSQSSSLCEGVRTKMDEIGLRSSSPVFSERSLATFLVLRGFSDIRY